MAGMTDVEFGYSHQRGDRLHVMVVEAMAGVDLQAEFASETHGFRDPLQLTPALRLRGVGIVAGVQFDQRCARCRRGLQLGRVGINKQRDLDPGRGKACTGRTDRRLLASHVEAALGGQFGALFRYQAAVGGTQPFGDVEHFVGDCHFEIQAGLNDLDQPLNVTILDMAPILAQVGGDAIGPRLLGDLGELGRVGKPGAALLA